ncbi:hypothetical protein K8638_22860 [Myxococcus sp. RHST-1-4]|nr:hypothetical protein [Myxococcus sp. RHSTA-1-4]
MQLGSACSAPNPHIKVRELDSGILEVDGPLAGPFDTSEELAAHACELLGNQPGADAGHGRLGKEYCALHYFAVETQKYYLSYLSDIGGDGPDGIKHCTVPMTINAPTQKEILILGPAHSHPHNREFSAQDMGAGRPAGWSPHGVSKIQEKRTGRIWERHLYVFHKNKLGVCFSYRYNYSNRLVHALREGAWVPIGKATGKWGAFEKFEGQDWLP